MIILFNKPFGVLCQFTDKQGRPTLADYIDIPNVYAAGRLDLDSEGLVVLTDDGQQQHRIADPQYKLSKRYCVQVEGQISSQAIKHLSKGVELNDGLTLPAKARKTKAPDWLWERDPPVRQRKHIPTSWLTLELVEGRNRQVRRMTAEVGFPTLRLIRQSVGQWQLQNLQPGEWIKLP